MSEQKIQFTIGSSFSGEGFTNARQAVQNLNKTTSVATGAMSKLLQEFSGINPKALAATKALTGVLNAFTSLNPVMLAVSAATAALSWGIQQCNKVQEEAKQRTEKLQESMQNLKEDFNAEFIKKVGDEIKKVTSDFEKCTKLANELIAATNKLNSSQGASNVITLEIEKSNAMFAALDENGRKLAGAYYDELIASEKLKNVKSESAAKVESATQAVYEAEQKLNIMREGISKLTEEQEALSQQYEANYGDEKAEQELKQKMKNGEEKLVQLHKEEEELRQKLNIAIINESTAKQDAANAIQKAELAETAAFDAANKLQEAIEKKAEEDEIAAETARQEADATARLIEQEAELKASMADEKKVKDEGIKLEKDLIALRQQIKTAENEYSVALTKYSNALFDAAMTKDNAVGGVGSNGMNVNLQMNQDVEAAIKAALANGEIRNVRELERFQRQKEKAERLAYQQAKSGLQRDKKAYESLMQKSRQTWSQADKKFADNFEKLKKAAEEQIKEVEEKKQQIATLKEQRRKNTENLQKIKDKLDQCVLK